MNSSLRSQSAVDISELDLKKGTSINFPEGKDKLMHFEIKIKPEEGTYKLVPSSAAVKTTPEWPCITKLCIICRAGTFLFDFTIATSYPHDAPKVKCKTKVRSRLAGVVVASAKCLSDPLICCP